MEVVDEADGKKAEKVEEEISFMVTNRSGGFCLLSDKPKSRFEGVFFRENNRVYKVIEQIRVHEPVKKIVNSLWIAARDRESFTESFFMPLHCNALLYELSERREIELVLDCKHIYDNREWGRAYEISKESGCILIKFTKRNSSQDSSSEFKDEFDIYTAVYSDDIEFKQEEKWERAFYELDKERESKPFERYVFYACRVRCKDAVFAFSTSKRDAIKEAKYVWMNRESLKKEKEDHVSRIIHKKHIEENEVSVAYQCSINALDSMSVDDSRISAGLPWFFQSWARDEIICVKALISMEEYEKAKRILFKYLKRIGPNGKLPEKDIIPVINSADATLWLFKRVEDFLDTLLEKKMLKKYVSKSDMGLIRERLEFVVSYWMKNYVKEGLVVNGPKETWMDSEWGGDKRDGARIEIQALFLACLRLLRNAGKKEPFEKELAANVRKMFFNGKEISDGALDQTIRPNVFIAAYTYPELFREKEWSACFENMLPKLWLSWGGLASIEKKSRLFTPSCTGELPKSYHRGDSWFWINNLAALVMQRIDRKKFSRYIHLIIGASIEEMLYMGVTGYSAELSSASKLKSQGCLCQAWSSAMFIEMIDEVYRI